MTELNQEDLKKLYEAIQCIRKTIHCTLCRKLPTATIAGRCGHPFCMNCIEKILNTKKAVCSICKTVLIRSAVNPVEYIDKIRLDLESLSGAIDKDLDAAIPQNEKNQTKKFDNPKQASGPLLSTDKKIILVSGSTTGLDFLKKRVENEKQNNNNNNNNNNNDNDRERRAKEIERRLSMGSEETIKIQKNDEIVKKKKKENEKDIFPTPSIPKAIIANQVSEEPVFSDDNLSSKIGAIGPKEKVEDWLNSDKFEEEIREECDEFEENVNFVSSSSSPTISEILESFSQSKPNYSSESIRSSKNNSRDSSTPRKNDITVSKNSNNEDIKYKSFTSEAINNRKRSTSSNAVTREDELFDELKRTSIEDEIEKRKSRVNSIQTESSWSELKKFKKETNPKVRKRKRLNVSIERPKQILETFEIDESMENKEKEINNSGDTIHKQSKSNEEIIELEESSKIKRRKPCLISSRTLEPNEMIDFKKLNRHQGMEIIADLNQNVSENSTNDNLETSAIEIKKTAELLLSRSGERSRNDNMELEEDPKSNFEDNSRPGSKQSNNPNHSRPGSRLSYKSPGKPLSEKFRLSTGRRSATPQLEKADEGQEKIKLKKNSPVRVSNDVIRNKLSLKRLSSGSSRITDTESVRSTSFVSFKKIGKLSKQRNKIKFMLLGSLKSKTKNEELMSMISTRSIGIQTSPRLAADIHLNTNNISSNEESLSRHIIIPETCTASAVSSDLKQIGGEEEQRGEEEITAARDKSSEIVARDNNSRRESDRVNRVNLLSPEKDSQLKYLATKSPSVYKTIRIDSDDSFGIINKSNDYTPMRKIDSFGDKSLETPQPEEFLKAVKKRAEKLILTDSEDQDTPHGSFGKFDRRNIDELSSKKGAYSPSTSVVSKTLSNLSNLNKKDDKIEAVKDRGVIIIADESPSVKSVGNNSGKRLSRASPKGKKYSRKSSANENERENSIEKGKSSFNNQMSGSYCDVSSESDAETVLIKKSKNENDEAKICSEDSEAWITPGKHKIVRKLKYSQESGKSGPLEEEKQTVAGSDHEKKKANQGGKKTEKKTFQRIRRMSSTDSENDDLLLVSLTTKQSSSNSQIITRSGISRETNNKSPILSEDMSIVFSSNKESTQESKRKRSPSPNCLDNNELQAIASNWCADAGDPSPRSSTPLKKLRIQTEGSPVSIDSDNLPVVNPLAIYESGIKVDGKMKSTEKTNSELLNIGESMSIDDLDEAVRQFDNIDENIQTERNNLRDIDTSDKNRDSSMNYNSKRWNSFPGNVDKSINKNSATLIKAKSLEAKNSSSSKIQQKRSENSDKENELTMRNESEKRKKSDNNEAVTSKGKNISSKEEIRRLERIEEENKLDDSSKDIQEPIESSFDRDLLNITQEEMLMQEIGDALLGKNSKKNNIDDEAHNKIVERTPGKSAKKNDSKEQMKMDPEDSDTMDEEDIIESTPDKNSAIKKDLRNSRLENSQRSNASLKSFMSMNITPIPKSIERNLQTGSNVPSPFERCSKSLINDEHLRRKSYHSTPKAANQSTSSKSNLLKTKTMQILEDDDDDDERKQKLCLVCSCLSLPQVQMVKEFACKYYAEYTTSYNENVTHVVVGTNESGSAARTVKYLYGIADKKWVVSYKWVKESMEQNKILEEENYEAVDSETEEPGARRSRLSKTPLFSDFAFVCMKPFAEIRIGEMQGLISATGGTVVPTLEDLCSSTKKYKLILYDSDFHDGRQKLMRTTFDNWRRRGNALPVMLEWVLSCISRYNLVSIRSDLQIDSDILSEFNFPPSVMAEEDEEEVTAVDDST